MFYKVLYIFLEYSSRPFGKSCSININISEWLNALWKTMQLCFHAGSMFKWENILVQMTLSQLWTHLDDSFLYFECILALNWRALDLRLENCPLFSPFLLVSVWVCDTSSCHRHYSVTQIIIIITKNTKFNQYLPR